MIAVDPSLFHAIALPCNLRILDRGKAKMTRLSYVNADG
jgi:hypothetical protein